MYIQRMEMNTDENLNRLFNKMHYFLIFFTFSQNTTHFSDFIITNLFHADGHTTHVAQSK
jgi:hypothetical protein